jgi:hypothetical protein
MFWLVSPAGTKELPAGRKRPQTLLSRFEAPTGTKGLKELRQKTPYLLGDFGGLPIYPNSGLGRDKMPGWKVRFLVVAAALTRKLVLQAYSKMSITASYSKMWMR